MRSELWILIATVSRGWQFTGLISELIGDPALVIRHPSGPWTISQYDEPQGQSQRETRRSLAGVEIQVGVNRQRFDVLMALP